MATYDSGTEGSIDSERAEAPLWTFGVEAAKRAEEAATCEHGVTGCPDPIEGAQWDNQEQCADCYGASFYIDWEESTDE